MWGNLKRGMVCGIVAACGLALGAGEAIAQDRVMVTSSIMGGGPGGSSGSIGKRSVEKWSDLLGLAADQKDAALALYEGYRAEYDAARKELNETMAEINRAYQESNDPSVFGEKMPAAQKKFADASKKLEKTLMADLRSLLSDEQGQAWPRVERMRRREIGGRSSTVSGDTVDLIEVVDGLKLDDGARAEMAEALEQYEMELDRAIQERIKSWEESPSFEPGRPLDMEAMQSRMKEARDIGLKLKDINQRNARKLESMLPEGKRAEFERAVRLATFPRVYRETHTSKMLGAAVKFEDLDESQRDSLTQLRTQYERELESANGALAAAIEKDEADPNRGGAMGGPGGSMVVRFGEENEELRDARKAKRELDERTRSKLESILKPEQQERLPKPEPEGEAIGGPGGGRVIIR